MTVKSDYYDRLTFSGDIVRRHVLAEGENAKFALNHSYGYGFSDACFNKSKMVIDFTYRRWDMATDKTGGKELRSTFSTASGWEWSPDSERVNNCSKRTSFRTGFNMRQMPYLVNDTKISDFGINFGASFPVSGCSDFDTAFKFGFRGTADNHLIRVNYDQVLIGPTINDHWFKKRRYD